MIIDNHLFIIILARRYLAQTFMIMFCARVYHVVICIFTLGHICVKIKWNKYFFFLNWKKTILNFFSQIIFFILCVQKVKVWIGSQTNKIICMHFKLMKKKSRGASEFRRANYLNSNTHIKPHIFGWNKNIFNNFIFSLI